MHRHPARMEILWCPTCHDNGGLPMDASLHEQGRYINDKLLFSAFYVAGTAADIATTIPRLTAFEFCSRSLC